MSRLNDILRLCLLVHGRLNSSGAIVCRNAGCDPGGRLDRDSEIGPQRRTIGNDHQRQIELAASLFRQGQADQSAAMRCHEVDGFRGNKIGCQHEIPLIFAVLGSK